MANIPTDPKFVPSLVFDDNTFVIKIYSPYGGTSPGNYKQLQHDINKALTDQGHAFSTILYAHTSSTYLQCADNSEGPAKETRAITLIEYFCPGTVADNSEALAAIHKVVKNAFDPNDAGLLMQYMIMSNVNMSRLDPDKIKKPVT
ncbi:PREDICTED: uncharacterized protein LOC109584416 isoform X2 [Amphimedon queenslandica]|uniref:Uncharacterized protein n=1 Tax=Amphimedon queenslandica TaxID=400682 RepID=A0A1X7U7L3_AMPQE|nr:PREDICTED: uncharacterized protein LOC109584416 isoform X2 [Amphimedon queenslandica]|eukprot:XP_019855721.1 PREDICTED: uncharacterized protein LOC109584416 isoform X2 [Amphimedon queenslandica]